MCLLIVKLMSEISRLIIQLAREFLLILHLAVRCRPPELNHSFALETQYMQHDSACVCVGVCL